MAVADINREAAEKAAKDNGISKVLTIDELLADPEVDLVINLTIPAVHYEINKKILEAGKHAYCEKPLAMTLEEANELTELAESKDLYVTSAPDTYLGSGIQTIRKLLDDGTIGRAQEKHVKEACETFMDKLIAVYGPGKDQFLKTVPSPFPQGDDPRLNMRGLGVADLAAALLSGRKPRLSADMSRHVVEALTEFKISSDTGKAYVMTTTFERPAPMPEGLKLWEAER